MYTIALFGGSFDPPHIGHIAIVEALEKLNFIDKIIVVPTFVNPFKTKTFASSQQRLEWLQCLWGDNAKVVIEEYELKQKRKVTTIETVHYLLNQYKKIYLVIGADNLSTLSKWHQFEELNSKVTFIIAPRDSIQIPKKFITLQVDKDVSSTELRENINFKKLSTKCADEIAQHYKENNAK